MTSFFLLSLHQQSPLPSFQVLLTGIFSRLSRIKSLISRWFRRLTNRPLFLRWRMHLRRSLKPMQSLWDGLQKLLLTSLTSSNYCSIWIRMTTSLQPATFINLPSEVILRKSCVFPFSFLMAYLISIRAAQRKSSV